MSIEQQTRLDPHAASYKNTAQVQSYTHDLGLCVLPVASRSAGHKVIRLHGGIAKRHVKWKAERSGQPPLIPAAADTMGDTLLGTTVSPSLPILSEGSGGYQWYVEGEYVYVQDRPRVAGENAFPVGNYPFYVTPQMPLGGSQLGTYANQIYASTAIADVDKFDTLAEYATAKATVLPDGRVRWPFLILPAIASSTHIIGG